MTSKRADRLAWTAIGFAGLLGLLIAFFQVMTTLAPYDDEGYVMMTLRTFGEHHRLYGETHTQYGPAFYLLADPLHSMLRLPLSQDAVRIKTVAFWLLSVLCVYGILLRWKVHPVLAGIAACFSLLHLEKLALEPGHPQEWALLLTLVSVWLVSGKFVYRWPIAAGMVALVGMIKINCGLVIALPLLFASCFESSSCGPALQSPSFSLPRNGAIRWFWMLTVAMILVPIFGIGYLSARTSWYEWLPFFTIGCGAFLACGAYALQPMQWRTPLSVSLSGAAVAMLAVLWAMVHGSSPKELWHGLVAQHQSFAATFFHPLPWNGGTLVFASLGLGALHPRWSEKRHRILFYLVGLAILGTTVLTVRDLSHSLEHGLKPRGAEGWLVSMGPALAPWLFVTSAPKNSMRLLLSLWVCLSPLIAFPTPGTQVAIGTLPSYLLLGVLSDDLYRKGMENILGTAKPNVRWLRLAVLGTLFILFVHAMHLGGRWLSNRPLGLHGSTLLRLPADVADKEIAITRAIAQSGCSIVAFDGHNHNRFYFRTQTRPLTSANPTFWPRMLSQAEKESWGQRLDQEQRLCVVIPPECDRLAGGYAAELRAKLREPLETTLSEAGWLVGVRTQPSIGNPSAAD